MDIAAVAARVAGLKTREYATEIENLAKNLGAALDDIQDRHTLNMAKQMIKPHLEKAHSELSSMLDILGKMSGSIASGDDGT